MRTATARLMLIIAGTLGATGALAAQSTYQKQLDAPPGGRMTFATDIGSVAVVGHDAPEVIVRAELHGSPSFLSRLRIEAEQTPSGVRISARGPHRGWLAWLGWFDSFDSGGNRAQFTVEVPRDYPVDLRTSGGGIDVRDLSASVHARTSGGGARVRNVVGAVDVHTSGGSIDAERLDGPAELRSSGGGIAVRDSTGGLELRTSGGGIRLQNDDGRIHASTSGGSIRADLQSNRGISLATSGGDITLLLPRDTHASLDAESGGGSITSGFRLSTTESVSGNHLLGAIGGGGARIFLHTSGGNIDLAPVE